jgi:hypothetical protein
MLGRRRAVSLSVHRCELPRPSPLSMIRHERCRRGEGRGGVLSDALSNKPVQRSARSSRSRDSNFSRAPADWQR